MNDEENHLLESLPMQEAAELEGRDVDEEPETECLALRKIFWYLPIIFYSIFTFYFIEFYISRLEKFMPRMCRNLDFKCIGHYLMRFVQSFFFLVFSAHVVFLFVFLAVDVVTLYKRHCLIESFTHDTTEETIFATDLIESIVSLGSCYYIFVNANIFRKLEIEFRTPLERISYWARKLPSGRSKFFSRIGTFLAYMIILTVPIAIAIGLAVMCTHEIFALNTYLEEFPEIINHTDCPGINKEILTNIRSILFVYNCMGYIVTLHWHVSPVFACIAVTYLCNELIFQTDIAIRKSKGYIMAKYNEIRNQFPCNMEENDRPIIAFYELTYLIKKCSNKVYYIATINIIAVIIILANLLINNTTSSTNCCDKQSSANETENMNDLFVFKSAFIYSYQFVSVWLMSNGIIALNTKLTKFSDSILSNEEIRNILVSDPEITSNERKKKFEKFKYDMKQELSLISGSKERFEIAFLEDFSISVFYTIIPLGVGAIISFSVRAIDATDIFFFDSLTN